MFSGRHPFFVPRGPSYSNTKPDQKMCAVTGANPAAVIVEGTEYYATTFEYYPGHLR